MANASNNTNISLNNIEQTIVDTALSRIFGGTMQQDNPQPKKSKVKKPKATKNPKSTKKSSAKKTASKRVKKTMAKTRAVNAVSTKKHLIAIADDGNAHSINDFLKAIQATEWKTESPNPYSVVAACLANNKGTFRQVSKGNYALIKE